MRTFHYAERVRVATPSIGAIPLHNQRGTVRTVLGPDRALVRMDAPVPMPLRADPRDSHVALLFCDECCPTGRPAPEASVAARLRGAGGSGETKVA